MNRSPLFLLLIFYLTVQVAAQRKQFIDSLKQDLTTVSDDSLKFRLLDELAWTYKRIDADSALMYGEEGLKISLGLDERLKGIVLATIGVTKYENGIAGFGISELHEALEISKKFNIKGRIAANYNNLGNAYENLGKFDSAIFYTTKAIALKLELGDKRSAARTMGNLALVYEGIGNVEKGIEYLEKALDILGTDGRSSRGVLHNLGLMLMKKGEYEKAKSYFLKSIVGLAEEGNESRFSAIYGNLGLTYFNQERYDSALFFTKKSFDLKKQIGQRVQLNHPAITLARIYLALNNFEEARKYGQIALQVTRENPSLDRQTEALSMLAKVENKAGNFEQAVKYYIEYDALKDSLLSEMVLNAAEEAEAKLQNQIKEQENQILRAQAERTEQVIRNQNITIAGSIVIVTLLLAIVLLYRKQSSERKKLLSEIATQAEKLRELDKAKTRFFANISHDLRSPLTLILGSLDKITERDYEILDSESKELLDLGYKNGKRLLYLADEIMDLTRLEEGKISLELQYVKIVPYLRLLTKMFSSAADIKSIDMEFNSDIEGETVLQIDPHQFEKIIYNLLSNAIKFTPEKGSVKVHLSTKDRDVKIEISDSGSGIPKESLDLIFDRYYQSESNEAYSQAGVGIGLALVKELVELHGGSISVGSSPSGTSFTIQFPLKESDWVSKAIVPERSLDVVTRNSLWVDLQEEKDKFQVASLTNADENAQTILIVEDHKELRTYLKSILSSEFRVYLAANGTHALDVLQSERIDLIVTDLMMPYMDGFEFIDQLKKDKDLRKLPVLVVSARTDQSEKLELLSKGAEEVINKPFDKEELLTRIRNILNKEWDNNRTLSKLYGETAEEFEKNIMARLERLIIKRVDDPHLSVLDLADEMAASERKVYRLIKKISGLTPYELIKEVRWQYLEQYLRKNKIKTASEAAQLIGMSNPSFFSDQYAKRFGHPLTEDLGD